MEITRFITKHFMESFYASDTTIKELISHTMSYKINDWDIPIKIIIPDKLGEDNND